VPVVIVVVQAILSDARDVDIGPSVIVEVSHGNSKAPALIGDSSPFCDVGECAIAIVMKPT
jgi:hypothetical protein